MVKDPAKSHVSALRHSTQNYNTETAFPLIPHVDVVDAVEPSQGRIKEKITSKGDIGQQQVWLVDFEFYQPEGEPPRPICMVAQNYFTGEMRHAWLWDDPHPECPIPLGPDVLYVAYNAGAELGCHQALGWDLPVHVLDLYIEFRVLTCGRFPPGGHGLLGALNWFGLGDISAAEKDTMRDLAIRGGPYSANERAALLDYCTSDVKALAQLLPRMWAGIDLRRALIRGRYAKAASKVESTGIPIDTKIFAQLNNGWDHIRGRLTDEVNRNYGVFQGNSFKANLWADWCVAKGIPWPRLPSGALSLARDTFREMSRVHGEVQPIHELRTTLSALRLNKLAVGSDGRNRFMTGVFGAKTGRNTPSSTESVFGPATWIRSLIKPTKGMAVAYIDWGQQELGIAAKLSGDTAMQAMYNASDPYIAFAVLAGAVPPDATKKSHLHDRDIYKVCALAVLMGMEAYSLGVASGTCEATGRRLLRQHKDLFPKFWRWSDSQVDAAMLGRPLTSVYGWPLHPNGDRPTTYRNFPLQANGADMMRLAAIAITERGIRLCAMVHDAFLIEAPAGGIEDAVKEARACMAAASRAVLGGFELTTEAQITSWPDRFIDKRGLSIWTTVNKLLGDFGELLQAEATGAAN